MVELVVVVVVATKSNPISEPEVPLTESETISDCKGRLLSIMLIDSVNLGAIADREDKHSVEKRKMAYKGNEVFFVLIC